MKMQFHLTSCQQRSSFVRELSAKIRKNYPIFPERAEILGKPSHPPFMYLSIHPFIVYDYPG